MRVSTGTKSYADKPITTDVRMGSLAPTTTHRHTTFHVRACAYLLILQPCALSEKRTMRRTDQRLEPEITQRGHYRDCSTYYSVKPEDHLRHSVVATLCALQCIAELAVAACANS
jgi:hypothetical protein